MTEADFEPSDSSAHPIEDLVEDYLARIRCGESPSIESYAERHPEHADEIREVFTAMDALEGLKSSAHEPKGAPSGPTLERLGDFRILAEIGRGGMGIVYEAEQITLGRRVAIKVLPHELVASPARRERFHREARTAAALHHTNIVPVFGTGEAEGHDYYVMQRIAGLGLDRVVRALRQDGDAAESPNISGSETILSDVLTRLRDADITNATELDTPTAPRPPVTKSTATEGASPTMSAAYFRNVARIGVQIADALDYAHGQGTLHRDIKPANLLLDSEGTAWITDFGLAKALEHVDMTQSGDVIGTLRYLAPEQFAGECDPRSDIYSLGLSLYELCTLRPAFAGTDRQQTIAAICSHRGPGRLADVAPSVPTDLSTVIEKACAPNPGDRYRRGSELAQDLRRFLEDRPISARPVSPIEATWRWCRRNRGMATLALLAIVSAAVAATAGWVGYAQTKRALDVAETRRVEAETAHALTASNLDATLRAFDSTLDEICGSDPYLIDVDASDDEDGTPTLATVPVSREMLPLLERILDYYQEFTSRNQDRAEVAWQAGIAHRRVGDIQQRLGEFEEAETAYRAALRLLGRAESNAATTTERALTDARTRIQLGRVLTSTDRVGDAIEQLQLALSTLAVVPSSTEVQLASAEAQNAIALAIQFFGPGDRDLDRRRRRKIEHHEEALAILQDLHEASNDAPPPAVALALARTLRYLVRMPRERAPSSPSTTSRLRTRAIEILEELCERVPEDAIVRFELAETLRAVEGFRGGPRGPRRFRSGSLPPTADLVRAYALLETLVTEHPNVVIYRESLAETCRSCGEAELGKADGEPRNPRQDWFALAEQHWTAVLDATARPTHRQVIGWAGLVQRNAERALRADRPGEARRSLEQATTFVENRYGTAEDNETLPPPVRRQICELFRQLAHACREDGDPTSAEHAMRSERRFRGPPR